MKLSTRLKFGLSTERRFTEHAGVLAAEVRRCGTPSRLEPPVATRGPAIGCDPYFHFRNRTSWPRPCRRARRSRRTTWHRRSSVNAASGQWRHTPRRIALAPSWNHREPPPPPGRHAEPIPLGRREPRKVEREAGTPASEGFSPRSRASRRSAAPPNRSRAASRPRSRLLSRRRMHSSLAPGFKGNAAHAREGPKSVGPSLALSSPRSYAGPMGSRLRMTAVPLDARISNGTASHAAGRRVSAAAEFRRCGTPSRL